MKKYRKPLILSDNKTTNLIPALAAAKLSAASAFAVGVATGLMKDDKNHASRISSINKVQVI